MDDIRNTTAEQQCQLCAGCDRKDCPNYVRRSPLSRFGYFMLHFILGVVSVAVLFCSFMAVRWAGTYLSLDTIPSTSENPFASLPSSPASGELTVGLGVKVVEVGDMAEPAGIDGGLVIIYMEENSAFAGTDVAVNDVIVAAQGVDIITFNDLRGVLAGHQPGDEITVTVARFEDGSPAEREVTISLIPLTAQ